MSDRAEAVHTAALALGVLKTYDVRVMVTKREEIVSEEYEAVDEADLEQQLRTDLMDMEREGDEIAYVEYPVGSANDEVEIDLRDNGEPFSWDACVLVKELAKAPMNLNPHLDEWIDRARKLLKGVNDE